MRFQKCRVISKSINSKSFGLTNIEIELEMQIHSIPIHSRKTNVPCEHYELQLLESWHTIIKKGKGTENLIQKLNKVLLG